MTEIIDLMSFSNNPNSHQGHKSSQNLQQLVDNSQSSFRFGFRRQKNQNTFKVIGKHCQHDLLFQVDQEDFYLIVRVYILTKNGHIFKIPSQISRVQLIRHYSSLNVLYQPKINPLTGFFYFQFNFFHSQTHSQFHQLFKIRQLIKQINTQKLFLTLQIISPSETILKHEKTQKKSPNQGKLQLPIVKAVAATFFNSDLQKTTINPLRSALNSKHTLSNHPSQLGDFLQIPKHHSMPLSPLKINQSLKDIESQHLSLSSLMKRKGGRSNYDSLLINYESQKNLKELIMKMPSKKFSKESMKIQDAELGKITLSLQRVEQKTFKDKLFFLQSLPKNCEYHFIDKYYKPPLNVPILISLSLKEESLSKFLVKNSAIMSLETKMRIMLQIYGAVNLLWQESKLMYFVGNLNKVFVTKNLGVKLRETNCFYKPQQHEILEDKHFVNKRLAESLLSLSQLYFKLFHEQNLFYRRPSADCFLNRSMFEQCKSSKTFQKLCMNKYLPNSMSQRNNRYITCLNYLFIEQMNVAGKIIQDSQQMERESKQEVWRIEGNEKQQVEQNMDESDNQALISTKMMACWLLSAYY